ncbi:RcnB family protein [Sphingomonas sp. RP10(2022)]|uniref:RcnB family protein n=1 Tax=Sphingomonas liriopis TaxID=2949094 RepID=A0A9X2KPI5_9SPHN|nr:RcnB family protein [Sphingomonas liriopis]MCP3733917.1 RcnB family protein [Sphingomonas liriopis]
MKTVIKALLAASMLMPIAAQAQEQDGRERGPGRRGGDWGERAQRPERSADIGVEAQVRAERPQRGDFHTDRPQPARDDGPGGRPDVQRGPDQRGPDQRGLDQRGPGAGWQANRDTARDDRRDARSNPGNDWRQADRGDRQAPRPDWRQDQAQRGQWRGNDGRGWNDGRNDRGGWNDGRNDRGGWNDNRARYDQRGGAWNRGWRNDGRYDWNRNRQLNRGAYRLPRYYAPSGWSYGYRRFSVGVSLSAGLFGRNYWIDDPYTYRLPEAYGPYRWVRYYDDALLVDLRSGQVVDTVYGIFY